MSGRYRMAIDNVRGQNKLLWGLVGVLVLVVGYAIFALDRARQNLPPLYVPPDLRFGQRLDIGEVPPANVYTFAGYVFQQLYRWPDSGDSDYGENIYRLQHYLTPRFRADLKADLELRGKRGELSDRTRAVSEVAGHQFERWRVQPLAAGVWTVWLDLAIEETVNGLEVKDVAIRYPIRVVARNVDPQKNPWGLKLDGYVFEGPRELGPQDIEDNPKPAAVRQDRGQESPQ